MLIPTKHDHPDQTVVAMATLLLGHLMTHRTEKFDSLRKFAEQSVVGGEYLLPSALSLLYLFGLVEYRSKPDAFEYIENSALS
jgi:hypothetical protein